MEIQDRNNILQRLLGTKSFGASLVQAVSGNFADMLGVNKAETETPVDFGYAKNNAKITVREKTPVAQSDSNSKVNEASKGVSEDKKSEPETKKTTGKKDVVKKDDVKKDGTVTKTQENNQPENVQSKEEIQDEEIIDAAVPVVPVISTTAETPVQEVVSAMDGMVVSANTSDVFAAVENADISVSKDVEVVANVATAEAETAVENSADIEEASLLETVDNQNIASVKVANTDTVDNVVEAPKATENVDENNKMVTPDNKFVSEENATVAAQPVVAEREHIEIPEQKIAENAAPVMENVAKENIDADVVSGRKDNKTYKQTEAVVAGEDNELLLRQAEYLDKKINTDGKIKVEVSVTEEKIAAPVVKDVLQNRFEVENMLRNFDMAEAASVVDVDETAVSTDASALKSDAQTVTISTSTVDNAGVAAVAGQQMEETSLLSTDASVVAVSGKEAVAEIANGMKTEAFAKINDNSSRDVFKGMGKEAVEQIKVNITKSAIKGVDTIDIQLKPEDLGKIQIKMHISKDGKIQAEIISGRQETLDMLQREVSGLAKAFEEAGYDTDSKSFSFSFQGDNQAGKHADDDSGLLKFIGDALEQETETTAGNDNIYDPVLGLNIRV